MAPSSEAQPRSPGGLMPRRGYVLALMVLVGSLGLVIAAWDTARERELRAAETRFHARTADIIDRLQRRLVYYELVARGGTSLFATVQRPTPRQWADYVEGMNLGNRFPAITGLGFAGHVSHSRLDDLQIDWRQAGYGQLHIRPHGVRSHYGPILFLEPRTPQNMAAIGYDMLSDPVRGAAMHAALESGTPQLSGPVSDPHQTTPSMLLFVPVYRDGDRPASRGAREHSMQGWVYVPFNVEQYVTTALGTSFEGVGLRIFDVGSDARHTLYASWSLEEDEPAFHHAAEVSLYGRIWRLEFESPSLAIAAPRVNGLESTLALGLSVCLLLYGVAWLLARTEDRAHAIALRLTEDYRRSEQRFRSSMHYSAIGKALLDSEGHIVEANPALGRIVGRTVESLVGVPFDSLFEDDEAPLHLHDAEQADANGVHRVTRRLRRAGDLPRQAQLTYAPLPGNVGQDITGLVQVEDVTERVRAEARVQALNRTLEARVAIRTRELRQVNQELEAFAYSVSHDLRAPLRAIDGFSRLLIERYGAQLEPAAHDYLMRVRKAAERMGELIDAILTISRLSRAELRREAVDLTRMAEEVIDELGAADRERAVEVRIAPDLQAHGDATLLRNLLGNLLGNAWKFTSAKTHAVIEFGAVRHPSGELEFYVRDNGVGFPQMYAGKLFRPFQRLHTQEEFSGHGIGLASVKRIIERHGGHIRAEGSEGEGAIFYFTLPREEGN